MTTITQGVAAVPVPTRPAMSMGVVAPRPMFRSLEIAAGGLSAQRARMEIAAQNIANAETTRTPEGGPYHRKVVSLEPAATSTTLPQADVTNLSNLGGAQLGMPVAATPSDETNPADQLAGVRVAGVYEDKTPGPMVYDPGHPDADANGYVRMPNVRVTDEMMEMMDARRVYDANATVFQVAKAMLHRALEI